MASITAAVPTTNNTPLMQASSESVLKRCISATSPSSRVTEIADRSAAIEFRCQGQQPGVHLLPEPEQNAAEARM